jgi:hypothetical protein
MSGPFSDLPGFIPGDRCGGLVRRGDHPGFSDGDIRGWIRARRLMLRRVSNGDLTADEYRATIAQFRAAWGDEINRRVNDYAIAGL